MALIAPSLLAADFARLGEALQFIEKSGASMVHVDVMDGHFVPEITVGQPVIHSVRKATRLILDLHLMIERPEQYISEFAELGADCIAIHAEATPNLHRALGMIRNRGAKAGLALNPCTSISHVSDALGAVDYLLILSADLGFGDSSYLAGSVEKVQLACALRRELRLDFAIQVDGGIRKDNVETLVRAGADILVAGSDIFLEDSRERLGEIMRVAASARRVSTI